MARPLLTVHCSVDGRLVLIKKTRWTVNQMLAYLHRKWPDAREHEVVVLQRRD